MNRSVRRDFDPLVPIFVVVLLVSTALGYRISGSRAAVTATGATVLGIIVVGVLRIGLSSVLHPTDVRWWGVVSGGLLLFGVSVFTYYYLILRYTGEMSLSILAISSVGIGVGVGYVNGEDTSTGLVHGVLAGGVGGLLFIIIATQQSFSMGPALNMIVLLSGVLAPLIFGVLCGLGGVVGGAVSAASSDSV